MPTRRVQPHAHPGAERVGREADLLGRPDDDPEAVAPLVVFLASDAAQVSGEIFRVAQGRIGLFRAALPEGVACRGLAWTCDEIAARLDEILRT